MKQILLISLILALNHSWAQSVFDGYRLEYRTQPYLHLANPDSVFFQDTLWFDSSYANAYYPFELGKAFSFPIGNERASSFRFDIGVFRFGLNPKSLKYYSYARPVNCLIREFSSTPPYQTRISLDLDSTVSGEPVLKFELKQLGLSDSSYQVKGYLNMQYWYYQNGDFEVHYGDCNIPDSLRNMPWKGFGKDKLLFFVLQADTFRTHYLFGVGAYDNLRMYTGITVNNPEYLLLRDSSLIQVPPAGSVYRFTKSPVGLPSLNAPVKNVRLFPNPAQTQLQIQFEYPHKVNRILAIDSKGVRTVLDFSNQTQTASVEVLGNGLYVMEIETDAGVMTSRLVIQR